MKIKSLQVKIAFWAGLCLLLTGAILITLSVTTLRERDSALAIKDAREAVREKADVIQNKLRVGLLTARTLAETLAGVKDPKVGLKLRRPQVNGILQTVLENNDSFNAIFMVWEPDAFDNLSSAYADTVGHDETGRFAPYWHWNDKGELEVVCQLSCPIHSPGRQPGEWYSEPMASKQPILTEPFPHPVRGKNALISSISVPIVANGEAYGVVGLDLDLSYLQNLADSVNLFNGQGELLILSNQGTILGLTGHAGQVGQPLKNLHDDFAEMVQTVQAGKEAVRQDNEDMEVYTPVIAGNTEAPWSVSVVVPRSAAFASATQHMWEQIGLGLTLVVAALICLWLVARSIARPIRKAAHLANSVAQGDLSERLDVRSADEVGKLAQALNNMAENLSGKVHMAETIAAGDLNVQVQLASERDEFGKSLQTMVAKLRDIVGQVNTAAEQISSGACQVSDSSQSLSQGATEQASSLEQISSSMTQMASQTKHNAENANQANLLANESRMAAEQGNGRMQAMVNAMEDISRSGQDVSKIIKVIDEIAFQTNLLALNAAVEAARAGQHGKGFAVVAEEVRTLAGRSAKAAQETAELIAGSVNKTKYGTQIAGETAESLAEIMSGITKASDLVAEIAAASNEQANGIAQINQGLAQIDQVTQSNTANAEESAAAAEELSSQSAHLKSMLGFFRISGNETASYQQATPSWSEPAQTSASTPGLGWDAEARSENQAEYEPVIALDDDDFGKY